MDLLKRNLAAKMLELHGLWCRPQGQLYRELVAPVFMYILYKYKQKFLKQSEFLLSDWIT